MVDKMKHLIYPIITLFLLAACQQEELPSGDGVGSLSLEDITVQAANVVTTRAVDEDLDLYVKINDVTYGPGKTPSKIDLTAGDYTLEAYNEAYTQYLSWMDDEKGEAVYYLSQQVEIEAGKVNYLRAEVPMINFGVRLDLPDGFASMFPKNRSFSVTVGNRTVLLNDGETAYFAHSEGVNVSYTLSATNMDGESNTENGNSNGWGTNSTIQPGTVYVITYDYATESLRLLAN